MRNAKKNETRDRMKADLQRFAGRIAAWERQGMRMAEADDDKEMARQTRKDVRDMNAIYGAAKSGEFKKAAKLAYRLDTIVRDEIPARLYNTINQ